MTHSGEGQAVPPERRLGSDEPRRAHETVFTRSPPAGANACYCPCQGQTPETLGPATTFAFRHANGVPRLPFLELTENFTCILPSIEQFD
jgi:hypothetical protein